NDVAERVAPCIACHQPAGQTTRDGYFPSIAGKPAGYLYNQLIHFRDGKRQSAVMTYMVGQLSDPWLREMAEHFAALSPTVTPPVPAAVSAAMLERGRQLVLEGDVGRKIPSCVACHGERLTGIAPFIPGVLGLPRDYLNAQFGAWKNGARTTAQPDCMATIASRLSVEEVSAVSA